MNFEPRRVQAPVKYYKPSKLPAMPRERKYQVKWKRRDDYAVASRRGETGYVGGVDEDGKPRCKPMTHGEACAFKRAQEPSHHAHFFLEETQAPGADEKDLAELF